jgi:hypothetical protein
MLWTSQPCKDPLIQVRQAKLYTEMIVDRTPDAGRQSSVPVAVGCTPAGLDIRCAIKYPIRTQALHRLPRYNKLQGPDQKPLHPRQS